MPCIAFARAGIACYIPPIVKPISRKRWFWIVLAAGMVIRLVYFFWSQKLPFFQNPITDALYHHRWAMAIADGMLWDGHAFFRAPFYPYVLAGLYSIFGPHIWIGKLFGHLIGVVAGGLLISLADRVAGRREAGVAAALWLGAGLVVFYEGELLLDSLFLFLGLAGIYFLLTGKASGRRLALSGLLFGLAAITRPTILITGPVILFWLWYRSQRRARAFLSFLLPGALPVIAVMTLNSMALGHLDGIATQGGVNFYIGNNSSADGISAVLPPPWGYAWRYADLERYAERTVGHPLDATEVSDFFYRRGLEFMREHPGTFLALALKKAVMSVHRLTISNNLNLPYVENQVPILKWLPVRVGWLVPLALAGLVVARRRDWIYRSLWAYLVVYSGVLIMFFVIERFRLPLVPIWIILAACGVVGLWEGNSRRRMIGLVAVAAGLVFVVPNWYHIQAQNFGLAYFNLGNVALREGQSRKAVTYYDSAVTLVPTLHQLHLNRGLAYLRLGEFGRAESDFRAEAQQYPFDARAFNNLSAARLLQGDTAGAQVMIDSGLTRDSSLSILYLHRLAIARAYGDTTTMSRVLADAEQHTDSLPVWTYWHAEEALAAGRLREARAAYIRYSNERLQWPTVDVYDPALAGPSLPRIDYQIALTYLGEGNLASATAYFAAAAEADSSFGEAWANWGTAALSAGDYTTAERRYRVALRSDPESPVYLTNLAHALALQGRFDEARVAVVKALAADSTFEPAHKLADQLEQVRTTP